ncbi:MAG TPA: class I SAM-dependent methyltransferase [Pyrinomonadaceae bacterium]|nr:class I SAM-dependent methyltransferase [Pyrinomonadaceae bacterium]
MESNLSLPNFTQRALREKTQYDEVGLQRDAFNKVFSHTKYYYHLHRNKILRDELQYATGRRVLEIGSQCWVRWIEPYEIEPKVLECINISSKALEKGGEKAQTSRVKPRFSLMDANHLEFEDESFDMVFGDAILHHLNFVEALDEIRRVLKPGGRILFCEPLGSNPVGKIVRLITPKARTADEQPLRRREVAEIRKRFETTFYYEQFLSVPVGIISKVLFSNPANILMKTTYELDRFLDSNFPPIRHLYRSVLIAGVRK